MLFCKKKAEKGQTHGDVFNFFIFEEEVCNGGEERAAITEDFIVEGVGSESSKTGSGPPWICFGSLR